MFEETLKGVSVITGYKSSWFLENVGLLLVQLALFKEKNIYIVNLPTLKTWINLPLTYF